MQCFTHHSQAAMIVQKTKKGEKKEADPVIHFLEPKFR